MKKYLVSIIIPVYNVQDYLRKCLDSIAHQTHDCLDVILIDDGSTDRSGEICDEYARQDMRFRVIHQQNAGAANAKNAGLDHVKGEYIAFIDSDDWAEPDWIQQMLNEALSGDAEVVECGFWQEYVGKAEIDPAAKALGFGSWHTEDYLRAYPTAWPCALFWNKLFKSNLLEKTRFHKERRCIDDEFFTYKAITKANKVVRIDRELYHYRQRRSSVTQSEKTLFQRTIDDIDILAERHQWMQKYCPSVALDYLRHDVDSLLYFAKEYPFNDEAMTHFKKTAWYYLGVCLRHYPGKVTMFYLLQCIFFPKRRFLTQPLQDRDPLEIEKYFP